MRMIPIGLAALSLMVASWLPVASAQSPAGMKLYVLNSGSLKLGRGVLQNFGPMEPKIEIPVGMFVIHHPKGNVMFDTGNNDKLITDRGYWGKVADSIQPAMTPEVSIESQLGKIGMKPDDIKYVVVSHMHLDHGGNVAKFPNSTLVIQDDEIQFAMFPDEPFAGSFMAGDVMALRSAIGVTKPNAMPMIRLAGDMDLFGDGSVVVHSSRGHTKGSQMLVVRLPKTGTIILTGDAAYFRDNVLKSIPPNLVLAYDPAGIMKGYEWIRYMMATEKADFFTAHDPDVWKTMKHAPEFYE